MDFHGCVDLCNHHHNQDEYRTIPSLQKLPSCYPSVIIPSIPCLDLGDYTDVSLNTNRAYHTSVQFSSVAQSCRTLGDLMDCSMPCFPVLHYLPEFAQTHVSWWCHPTISSSVVPFSSCLQSFPASGSFPMSQFFASGGQSIGASASASVLTMNIQITISWPPF